MTISTPSISSSKLKPGNYVDFNLMAGPLGLPLNSQKLLLIGQKLTGGTAIANKAVQVLTPADAATLFGAGSVAHRMVISARKQNRDAELWVIPMDDAGSSTAATGTVTLTGTATASGTLTVWVGNDRVDIGVLTGDTAATLATRARTLIGNVSDLPISIAGTTGALVFTAKNKGTCGNAIQVNAACSAAGMTLSAASVQLATGATDPTIQTALDAVFPAQFHVIVPWTSVQADLVKVRDHLETVSGPIEKRPGRAFAVAPTTALLSDCSTITATLNHERVSLCYLRGSWSPAWEIASSIGMAVAEESDPARILNGVSLPGIHAPEISTRLSVTEQETLLAAGVTPLEVVDGAAVIVRLVTSRTTYNSVPTLRLMDTTTIASLDYFRFSCLVRWAQKFPQAKLNQKTLDAINLENLDVAKLLESKEILQNVSQYADAFQAEIDPDVPGRARCRIPAPVVPGLHQIYGLIDLILN